MTMDQGSEIVHEIDDLVTIDISQDTALSMSHRQGIGPIMRTGPGVTTRKHFNGTLR